MNQQGRSPRYQQGVSAPPEPLGDRAAAGVWVAETVLLAAFATLTTLHLIDARFPTIFATVAWIAGFAVVGLLRSRAHRRPYPSPALKVFAVVSVVAVVLWLFVLVAWADELRTTELLPYVLYTAVTWVLFMGAIVLVYRARFFFWWRTTRPVPPTPSYGTGRGDG